MKKNHKTKSKNSIPQILSIMLAVLAIIGLVIVYQANMNPATSDSRAAASKKSSCEEAKGSCMTAKSCQSAKGIVLGRMSCQSGDICCIIESPTATTVQNPDKRVFFTSTHFQANLGGLAGADSKCQARANAAGLGGQWVAWLSDSNTDAKERVTQTTGNYKLLDGTVIANGWADLTDGNLNSSIDVDEFGVKRGNQSSVWSATNLRGEKFHTVDPSTFCNNFTQIDDSYVYVGNNFFADVGWTTRYFDYQCNGNYPLYCFEK